MKAPAKTPKMTRAHFALIAHTLAMCEPADESSATHAYWQSICNEFARVLAGTNARFDKDAFLRACKFSSYCK